MIPGIFGMLSRLAVEIHTLPAHQDCSLDILHLKGCWSQPSYRSDKLRRNQLSGIHPVYQETFLHIHRLLHQLRILKNWILCGRKLLKNQFTCLQRRKVKDQNDTQIWDASPDRQPKNQSSSVEETLQGIMGQTHNDCRFRIFILTSSSNLCLLEDKIQDRGLYLFTISYGSDAVDQRSGVGWFSGRFKILFIYSWYFNAEFWSTRCEDCFSPEQDHP